MKRAIFVLALLVSPLPMLDARAASPGLSPAIQVSVTPAAVVPEGATVTIIASTTRHVSNVWVFDGSMADINNVVYVASCDAPPHGSFLHCSGRARYARGIVRLPDTPYRQRKKTGNVQTFFACWNSITPANCSKAVTVTWKRSAAGKYSTGK